MEHTISENNLFIRQFFECRPDLVRRLSGKIRDSAAREDLLQDIFVKFYLKIGNLSHHDNLCGYLYRITDNVVVDYYRQESRFVGATDESIFEKPVPVEAIDGQYQLANCCLCNIIDRMPPKYREALILTELEGRPQKEAASDLKISYSGFKSRVQRAREMLKEMILACCRYDFDKYGNIVGCCPTAAKN